MVRVKVAAPSSTVQLQREQAPQQLASDSKTISIQTKTQVEHGKPTTSEVRQRQYLTQRQSLQMVQIMLHVSFGTLFYLRELLPLPCFDDRDLKEAQREQNVSYEEFIGGKAKPGSEPVVPFGKGKRGQPLKIIVRGADPKADNILDVLETGVFDALSMNVLEALQLTIFADQESPDNVLETYTFSFHYTGGPGDMNRRLESLSIDNVGCVADMKYAQTARIGLETIIRRLITLSTFLPTLPNKRNLGVHLFYTENCPPEYEPPGFTTARNETINYPRDNNWKKETQSCGVMDGGWHVVGLNVTSLKWIGPSLGDQEVVPKIPQQLEYGEVVKRCDDIGFPDGRTPSKSGENDQRSIQNTDSPVEREQSMGPGETSSNLENATPSQDAADRQRLQMMMQSQEMELYSDSDIVPTQPISPDKAPEIANGVAQKLAPIVALSPEKTTRIREFRSSSKPSLSTDTDDLEQVRVRCQCGWEGEEEAMIQCAFCFKQQHARCYGFENTADKRIPDVHACYQCLLEQDEPGILRDMGSLVLLRRAVRIILNEGFPNQTSGFMQKLHCNGQTVIQITDLLRKKGILQGTPGYKAKGFLQKGLPKFTVPASDGVRQKIDKEILDPMLKIKHHYVYPGSNEPRTLEPDTGRTDDAVEDVALQNEGTKIDEAKETAQMSSSPVRSSDANTTSLLGARQTRKRTQMLESEEKMRAAEQSEREKKSMQLKATSKLRGADTGKGGLVQKGNMATPKVTPQKRSPRQSFNEGELRRSSRKRRKASNYAKPIDVGAETSDYPSA
ncbi:hypothetical protein P170DRAFT_404963 [Aspergillus steynii IBT 23096]|uniref:HORMA domain-containing protein n=1 Tax=Aspergillus steynii IBT 23096 TaxID=1392250 RepID=A0A2I2GBA8_9EURO|nr:uncharacterized protein P170DRAFT_404963 [Aspergillus steynii IBT 23096]PLB50160.1 hypothetical protein P170DRAFT_404963 [Aspergillus steynii IBT 23096]